MTHTLQANGKTWKTDKQTFDLMAEYRAAGNKYMVSVVFNLAHAFGRMIEVL